MNAEFIRRLQNIVGKRRTLSSTDDLRSYQYDGSVDRGMPQAVVLPGSAAEIAAVVKVCNEWGVPFLPRGAGTGLSGGAVAEAGGVIISTARLHRILEIDAPNQLATVEPGVVNAEISAAVKHLGLRFVPDPSSMGACTVGGNVAENAGGLHCLAYGVTANHVLGVEIVTPDGDITWLGGKSAQAPGYDLLGVFIGSEGTLGIATKAVVKLAPVPEASRTLLGVFDSIDSASQCVSDIIARGIIPGALEMMDQLTTQAVEEHVHAGFPTDAAAILMVEVDGLKEGVVELLGCVREVCARNHAREIREPADEAQREAIWKGRKSAFGAMGRLSPTLYVQDGVIPRTRLPEVLREVEAVARRYDLRITNVFHAGDGNLHPLILFDERKPGDLSRAVAAGADILRACVACGGSISGEHGIGTEKRDCMTLQFSEQDLDLMRRLKAVFNPRDLCNPTKIFPTSRRCGESAAALGRLPAAVAAAAGEAF